jgi:tetratricopeptide (TPR) repeat protein
MAALALARLLQSTGEPLEAHAVLAPALEAFSLTPEMPEIAEAQSLLGALAETEEVKAAEAQRQRRLHLQTAYGQAMMWAKGFSAEETSAAFSRATELSAKTDNFAERFAAGHFQWISAFVRGELRSARDLQLSFLKEAEDTGRIVEAGVARRGLALACYQAGDFIEARNHCERALEACNPENERETQERFQGATGPWVTAVLAVTMWQLGEVDRARELIEQANQRASDLGYAASMAHPLLWKVNLEILRGDPSAGLIAAEALRGLGQGHGLPFYRTSAEMSVAWARGRLHDAATGAEDLRRALADRIEQGMLNDAWFFKGLLAELEAETLGAENALTRTDEAIALARQVETRCNLPFLHLLRGKLLLERDPSNPAPAEEAFQSALAIAREQGARSWGLRAALSLAKIYKSTARSVDAHTVLAPALEGFSPTPEMPEIAEAQALLAALAETDEAKVEIMQRRRLTRLNVAYGNALFAARGYGAPETTAAFARARGSAYGDGDARERLAADYGLWVGSCVRGELSSMRAYAEAFVSDVTSRPNSAEASIAHRICGVTHQFAGEYVEARSSLERALALHQSDRDDDLVFDFGLDAGVTALLCLAIALWPLGEVDRATSCFETAQRQMAAIAHAGALAYGRWFSAVFDLMRRDLVRAARSASELARVAREHNLAMFQAFAVFLEACLTASQGKPGGLEEMRRGVELLHEQNVLFFDGLLKIALAEAEAGAGDPAGAVIIIDDWRQSKQPATAPSKRSSIACRENCCSGVRPLTLRSPNKRSKPPSPSHVARRRGASNCALRFRSPNSINRLPAPLTPALSSRPR